MAEYILPSLGSLTVEGPATLDGATNVNNALSVSGQANLQGGLQTAANSSAAFNGSVTLNGGGQVPAGQTLTNAGTIANTGTINNASGTITGGQVLAASAYASLASAYTTTSTTPVSTGLGVQIASPGSNLTVELAAIVASDTAGDGVTLAIYRSTASIPAAGSAPGANDVALWNSGSLLSGAANQQQPVSAHVRDTGLAAGTTYYYYLAAQAVTGGTAGVNADTAATTLVVRAVQ